MSETKPWRRPVFAVLAVVLVAAAVAVAFALRDGTPLSTPPTPTAEPSPQPSPTPVVQPDRFRVRLVQTRVHTLGNGWIFRRRPGNSRRGADRPARAAVRELTRYLNAEFVNPVTRFTDDPVDRLLTGAAEKSLDDGARSALGVGAPAIAGGRTGDAVARADVLFDGRRAYAVTLSYRAALDVALHDGDGTLRPLRQRGVMVFVPLPGGWRADMVDVSLRLPPPRKQPSPAPQPSSTATEETS